MADDTSTNWGNLLSGLGGVAGSLVAGHQATSGAENASNLAQFKNINVGLPTGAVQATNANGNLNYNVNSPAAGTYNMFQGLANTYGNAASNPNNPFVGAANKAVTGYQGFDPQAASNTAYQNLSALAAPGETDQTQQMLNYEQATGRGGVTQNGQLGDLGGLALSQQTADNQRRLQAQQLGLQQQESLASQATGLLSAGNQWNTANVNNANNASTAGNNINSSLLDLLKTAITGQSSQATAGANAAQYQYDLGLNKSNNTDSLLGSLLQGSANGGGIGGGGGIGSILKGLGGIFSGSGGGFDTSNLYSNGDDYLNNTDFSGMDPSSVVSFDGAGGQAASQGGGGSSNGSGIGTALAAAKGARTAYSAANSLGLLGGGGGGLGASAAGSVGSMFGDLGASTAAAESGVASSVAASNAAALGGSTAGTGAAGAGAAGSGGAAGASGAAGSAGSLAGGATGVGLALAPLIFGMSRAPIGYSQQWTNNLQSKANDVLKQGVNADPAQLQQMLTSTAGVPALQGLHQQIGALITQQGNQVLNQRAAAAGVSRAYLDSAGTGRTGGFGKGGATKGKQSY